MFKALKNKVGEGITQANNKLKASKGDLSLNNDRKNTSIASSSISASSANSLIDLNSESKSINKTSNDSINQPTTSNYQQSPAILEISNSDPTEDSSSQQLKNWCDVQEGSNDSSKEPLKAHSSITHSTPVRSRNRTRNDSMTSQMSDTFFMNVGSSFSPSQQFLSSDVESVASEVDDHNLLDALGMNKNEIKSDVPSPNIDSVSKEDLSRVLKKIFTKNQKFSGKYYQLVKEYRELDKERTKLKEVLTKCQDKAIRRISELKEQMSLKQMAINDVEVNYKMMLDEKQEMITVLQKQVSVLKGGLKVNEKGQLETEEDQKLQQSIQEIDALKEKNAKLTKLLSNCKTTILDHREEIKVLTNEKNQLLNEKAEHQEFNKLNGQLKDKIEDLQEELSNYRGEKKKWMKELHGNNVLLEDLRRLVEEKTHLEEQVATLMDQNKLLTNKVQDAENQIKSFVGKEVNNDPPSVEVHNVSSSTSLPSSSLFGEHRTIVPNQPGSHTDERCVLDKLVSENNDIRKNLLKFKRQARVFKKICQCVFKVVVLDSHNHSEHSLSTNKTSISNNNISHNVEEQKCNQANLSLDPEVCALYTKLYDENNDLNGDFLFKHNEELKNSIVSVLKSGLYKSMLKLKNADEVSNNNDDSPPQSTRYDDDADDDDGWVTEDEVECGGNQEGGSFIEDYDNLILHNSGDDYLNRLLSKWKESCEKYEQQYSQRRLSEGLEQAKGNVQVDQCYPFLKTHRPNLVVVQDDQCNSDQVNSDYCDTDDDKMIKGSLLEKFESLRIDYEQLQEQYISLVDQMKTGSKKVEIESVEEATLHSDEVKAQQLQVSREDVEMMGGASKSDGRLMEMSGVIDVLKEKNTRLMDEISTLQESFNKVVNEKIELEKDLLAKHDESDIIKEKHNLIDDELDSLKNELNKLTLELKVKSENYEYLKGEYEQVCEEINVNKKSFEKLKASKDNMDSSIESLNKEVCALKQDIIELKTNNEDLQQKLSCEEKKLSEKEEIFRELNDDVTRIQNENIQLVSRVKTFEEVNEESVVRFNEQELLSKELSKKNEEMKHQLAEFVSKNDELKIILEENETLTKNLTSEIQELKKNDEVVSKMEQVNKENESLKKETERLKEMFDQLQITVEMVQNDLQNANSSNDDLNKEICDLRAKLENDKSEIISLNEELKEATKTKEETLTKLEAGARISSEISNEVVLLKEQLELKTNEVKKLKADHKEKLEMLKNKFNEIRTNSKNKLAENEEKMTSLKNDLDILLKEKESLIKTHDENVKSLSTQNTQTQKKYEELQQEVKKNSDKYEKLDNHTKITIQALNQSVVTLNNEISTLKEKEVALIDTIEKNNIEITKLKKFDNELRGERDELQKLMGEKGDGEKILRERVCGVEEMNKNLEAKNKKLQKENESQKEKLEELTKELSRLHDDNAQHNERTKSLEEEIKVKTEQSNQCVDLSKKYEDKICRMKSEYDNKMSQINDDILKKSKEITDLQQKIDENNKKSEFEISDIKEQLENKIIEIEKDKIETEKYKNNSEALELKLAEALETRDALQKENDEMKSNLQENDSKSSESLQEINNTLTSLQSENQSLRQEADSFKDNIKRYEDEIDVSKKTIEDLKCSQDSIIKDYDKKIQEEKIFYEKLELSIKEKENTWTEKMNELKKKAEIKIKQLRKRIEDLTKEASNKDKSSEEIKKHEEEVMIKSNEITQLNSQNNELKLAIEKIDIDLTSKTKMADELMAEVERVRNDLKEKESQFEAENTIKKETIEKLEKNQENDIKILATQFEELKNDNEKLTHKITSLNNELKELTRENEDLKEKIETFNHGNDSSNKELRKELKTLSKLHNKLKEEHDALKEKHQSLSKDAEKTKNTEIERLKQEYTEELSEKENDHMEKIKKLMREFQTTLTQKEQQYQVNFTKTLEDSERDTEVRMRTMEDELKDAREDVRFKDDQLDELGQQVIDLNNQLLTMHSNDAWEELNQKCAELEEEIIEKDKAIMDKNEEIKKKLEESHHSINLSDLKRVSQTDSQMSLDSCGIIPVEFEYLKAVLFKYMTESPDKETLAKVLCRIMKYTEVEEKRVLTYNKR